MTETATLRQPLAWLLVDGMQVPVKSWQVNLTRNSRASDFECVMALDEPRNPGPAFWAGAAPIPASVIVSDGVNTRTLINGSVYVVHIDWVHRLVTASGYDRTAELTNARSDQKFQDMKTIDVVSQIAARHGLSVNIGGSADFAGRSFDGEKYAYNSDAESDWDVVQACAEQDGRECFVNGNQLYYVDPGNASGDSLDLIYSPPTPEQYESGNFVDLKTTRDVQISEGVSATVASWHTHDKQAYVAGQGKGDEARSNPPSGGTAFTGVI